MVLSGILPTLKTTDIILTWKDKNVPDLLYKKHQESYRIGHFWKMDTKNLQLLLWVLHSYSPSCVPGIIWLWLLLQQWHLSNFLRASQDFCTAFVIGIPSMLLHDGISWENSYRSGYRLWIIFEFIILKKTYPKIWIERPRKGFPVKHSQGFITWPFDISLSPVGGLQKETVAQPFNPLKRVAKGVKTR